MLWFVGVAWSAECRWKVVETVTADMTHVYINGQPDDVLGGGNWRAVQEDYDRCGWGDAALGMGRWRQMRQATNVLVGCGFLFPPLWVGAGVTGILAGERRAEMEGAIRREGRAPPEPRLGE